MARIRTIKPDFWTDSLMVQLPYFVRLFYISLWNAADDHGFLPSEIDRLGMELMPREKIIDVDKAFQLLEACGRIELFVSDSGEICYKIAKWACHQKVDRPTRSKIYREGSRKLAIPLSVRREIAIKYGCQPGKQKKVECYYCGCHGEVYWFSHADGRPSSWVTFPGLEIDHVIPEVEGGENRNENIVLACRNCNRSKGTKHWVDFMLSRGLANPREVSRKNPLDQGRDQGEDQGRDQGSSICTEPEADSMLDEPLADHGFILPNGTLWRPTVAKVKEWQTTFQNMDIDAQLRLAAQWLKDNPARRKTERGMHRFLFSWLEKAQNSNRALPLLQQPQPAKPNPYGNCPRYS